MLGLCSLYTEWKFGGIVSDKFGNLTLKYVDLVVFWPAEGNSFISCTLYSSGYEGKCSLSSELATIAVV